MIDPILIPLGMLIGIALFMFGIPAIILMIMIKVDKKKRNERN